MSKITCLVLCAVAVSSVYATISEEEKSAFREALKPLIEACAKDTGVSHEDINAAKEAGDPGAVNPCFVGCVFKKAEIFDSEGKLNLDKGLEHLKKFVKSGEDFDKLAEIGKKCSSVNDQAVSDGTAGCERAKLLLACAVEHKAEFPF